MPKLIEVHYFAGQRYILRVIRDTLDIISIMRIILFILLRL